MTIFKGTQLTKNSEWVREGNGKDWVFFMISVGYCSTVGYCSERSKTGHSEKVEVKSFKQCNKVVSLHSKRFCRISSMSNRVVLMKNPSLHFFALSNLPELQESASNDETDSSFWQPNWLFFQTPRGAATRVLGPEPLDPRWGCEGEGENYRDVLPVHHWRYGREGDRELTGLLYSTVMMYMWRIAIFLLHAVNSDCRLSIGWRSGQV